MVERVDKEQIPPSGKGLNENGRGENRMMAKMTTGTKTQMGWGWGGVPILALKCDSNIEYYQLNKADITMTFPKRHEKTMTIVTFSF